MKNFNDIYQKIYQENIHIEENRKVYLKQSRQRTLIAIVILTIITFIVLGSNLTFLLPFVIFSGIIILLQLINQKITKKIIRVKLLHLL